jgi:hypothetical protein
MPIPVLRLRADNRKGYSEAYAQAAVMLAYDLNVGEIDDVGEAAEDDVCMSTAMDVITSQLSDYLTYFEDATCNMEQRWEVPAPWCISNGTATPCQTPENSTESSENGTSTEGGNNGDDGSAGVANSIAMSTLAMTLLVAIFTVL